MALYLDKDQYALFSSPNLKNWTRLCDVRIPGASECPEFFEIPVEGVRGAKKWVFYGGNGRYLIGTFDGKTFTPENGPHALNSGNCFYASQTFHDLPARDGRRVLIPWGQMATPGMPFNQMMGLPIALTLCETDEGLRLLVNPVKELQMLRQKHHRIPAQSVRSGQNPFSSIQGELLEVKCDLSPGTAREIVLVVCAACRSCTGSPGRNSPAGTGKRVSH